MLLFFSVLESRARYFNGRFQSSSPCKLCMRRARDVMMLRCVCSSDQDSQSCRGQLAPMNTLDGPLIDGVFLRCRVVRGMCRDVE